MASRAKVPRTRRALQESMGEHQGVTSNQSRGTKSQTNGSADRRNRAVSTTHGSAACSDEFDGPGPQQPHHLPVPYSSPVAGSFRHSRQHQAGGDGAVGDFSHEQGPHRESHQVTTAGHASGMGYSSKRAKEEGDGEDMVDMACMRPQGKLDEDMPPYFEAANTSSADRVPNCGGSHDITPLRTSTPQVPRSYNDQHYVNRLKEHHKQTTLPAQNTHRTIQKVRKNEMAAKRPSKKKHRNKDNIDHAPPELPLSILDLLGNLIGIGSYLFDVGTDCWVAYTHYARRNWWWFGLTLSFVIGPSLVMTFFSSVWYMQESRSFQNKSQSENDSNSTAPSIQPISRVRWVSRFVFLFLQIAPVLRWVFHVIHLNSSKVTTFLTSIPI